MSKSLPTRSAIPYDERSDVTSVTSENGYLVSLDGATNLRLRKNRDNSYSVEVLPEDRSLPNQQGRSQDRRYITSPSSTGFRRYSDDEVSVQSSVTSPLYEKVPPLQSQIQPSMTSMNNGYNIDPKMVHRDASLQKSNIQLDSPVTQKSEKIRSDLPQSGPQWSDITDLRIQTADNSRQGNFTFENVDDQDIPRRQMNRKPIQSISRDEQDRSLHFTVSKGETGPTQKFVFSQLEAEQQAVLYTDENQNVNVKLVKVKKPSGIMSWLVWLLKWLFTVVVDSIFGKKSDTSDETTLSGDEKSELTKALRQLRGTKSKPSPWLKIKKVFVLLLSFILPFRIYNVLFGEQKNLKTAGSTSQTKEFFVRLIFGILIAVIRILRVIVRFVLGWILPFKMYQVLVSTIDKFEKALQTQSPKEINTEDQPLLYTNQLKILNYRVMAFVERPVMKTFRVLGKLFDLGKSLVPKLIILWYYYTSVPSDQMISTDEESESRGTIVLATVQGDVHDIGKNIVAVVMESNDFRVIDIGVSVPASRIISTAILEKADLVGLSGLVAPSLDHMIHVAKEMEKAGLNIPILIGGAAASKAHTARKIAPNYSHPVVYVPTAYKSVEVASRILDPDEKAHFLKELAEDYNKIRAEHHEVTKVTQTVTIEHARAHKLKIDWFVDRPVAPPRFLGRKAFLDYDLNRLIPYIDWKPFFDVWQLQGKYPNRGYPKIFDDKDVGQEARKLYDDAKTVLTRIINNKQLKAHGVVAFYPANSVGDDIEVYGEGGNVIAVLHGLRQQTDKGTSSEPYLCISDFIAPKETGIRDYIGLFAVTAGYGVDEICKQYFGGPGKERDNYSIIMVKALADRLAETFAEELHQRVRKELWGYSPNEDLTQEDLHKVKYQGIRPAPGYPSQPDHSEKEIMWTLLQADKVGITLTDTMTMNPPASVSGLYLSHPKSYYFATGKINRDQIQDYALRKQMRVTDVERWLSSVLAYDV